MKFLIVDYLIKVSFETHFQEKQILNKVFEKFPYKYGNFIVCESVLL